MLQYNSASVLESLRLVLRLTYHLQVLEMNDGIKNHIKSVFN